MFREIVTSGERSIVALRCSWPGTSKTLAGTAIGALCGVAFAAFLVHPLGCAVGGGRWGSWSSPFGSDIAAAPTRWLALSAAVFTVSILETFTQQIDNLLLPAMATALFLAVSS